MLLFYLALGFGEVGVARLGVFNYVGPVWVGLVSNTGGLDGTGTGGMGCSGLCYAVTLGRGVGGSTGGLGLRQALVNDEAVLLCLEHFSTLVYV